MMKRHPRQQNQSTKTLMLSRMFFISVWEVKNRLYDTFCGCVLHYICENGLEDLSDEDLKQMLTFANAAASLVTTRKGALRVMPEEEEILELLKK